MARKKTQSTTKSSQQTKKPASKASAPQKTTPAKSTSKTQATKQTPTPSRGTQSAQAKGSSKRLRRGLSLDRKLDIAGIVLSLVGVLTLLSLLSPVNGSLTAKWVSLLSQIFGLGVYIFPLGMIGIGLWLILRNFERIPLLSLERVVGISLLFITLLAGVHLVLMLQTGQSARELAAAGEGGGYLGGVVSGALKAALGYGGAMIALLALLLISLAISLDISIMDLVRWIPPRLERLQDSIGKAWGEFRSPKSHPGTGAATSTSFKPLPPGSNGQDMLAGDSPAQESASTIIPKVSYAEQSVPHAWVLPPVQEILEKGQELQANEERDWQRAHIIEETLSSFSAPVHVVEINRGPTITQFGVEPDFIETRMGRTRVRVGKIASLSNDLALALSARTVRIQAPVPGKGYVGIEVPNEEIALVTLRDLIESEAFKRLTSPLRFALGLNVSGNAVAADLSAMPHLLIAGATGSGKSVCVNALICCLLMNNTPDDLRLIMVDPKRVELTGYNGIPHLLAPVVVEIERVVGALQWVTREMDERYHKLAEAGCRNLHDYNAKQQTRGGKKLPFLVVMIDELADLMMIAPDETERTITRLAQLARATGIHLVISTQRPSVDVVTGLIKANFPARIAFAVASGVDSRVILDQPGAETLLGRGDMLFQAPDTPAPIRLQGVFVSDGEIQRLVSYWQSFSGAVQPTAHAGAVDALPTGVPLKQIPMWQGVVSQESSDPLLPEAIDLCRRQGRASISMLQRRLRIGYTRAARLVETMEEQGIVGPPDPGTGTREILDYGPAAPPVDDI